MPRFSELLAVGVGGFVGAIARYGISAVAFRYTRGAFPLGTLAVNLLGCFAIGAVMALFEEGRLLSPQTRLFVTVGVLGSLTTFSTFGYETVALARAGSTSLALLNVAGNLVLGIAGVLLGGAAVRLASA